jgi:hypothetical protein
MNTEQIDQKDSPKPSHDEIVVRVRYPAAPKPFVDPHASRSETVGALQMRVMGAFEVQDTSNPDGSTTQYSLYLGDVKLENPSQALGKLDEQAHELALKLVQLVVQG